MALRIAQVLCVLISISAAAQTLEYPVRHKRLAVDCGGRLTLEDRQIVYHGLCGKGDKEKRLVWSYDDAQELHLYPSRIVLRGYLDRRWLAGADEVHDFRLEGKVDPVAIYRHLRARMDDRLIARIAYPEGPELWRLPAKLPAKWEGAQGELILYSWGLVFSSPKPGASRTWTDAAVLNIAGGHPRALTVTTAEGEFAFQLKRNLQPAEYDVLWFRLNRPRGLTLIPTQTGERPQ